MTSPFPNSYWLEPGRILCGEYPRDFDDLEDHEGMSAILGAGVRVFIDLTEEGELKPYHGIALETAASLGIAPTSLEFHRHPIRDVSVPRTPAEMRAVLATIRYARHRALPLYLHCWGGRGRTGTVAGCALRDLFSLDGDEALARLGERWQGCAKSAHSESPETREQRGYVRGFNPLASPRGSHYRPALLGAAVGDALGVPVEFQGRHERTRDPVTGMRAFGTHHQPAGTWSDDTSMILATLTGLLKSGDYNVDAVMEEFVQWLVAAKHSPHGEVFDVGGATRAAIHRFEAGVPALECGGEGESSNGNGSLMRILPIALAAADEPDLIDLASTFSSITHAHERSRFCCAFFCLVISELTHGTPLRGAALFAWSVMDRRWTFSPAERRRFEKLHPDLLFDRTEDEIASSGHVIDTLEAALWVNARHDDFASAVLHAVNLGDDTDTTGCVAGALAGIIHGIAGIPGGWRETLVKVDQLDLVATEFAAFAPRKK